MTRLAVLLAIALCSVPAKAEDAPRGSPTHSGVARVVDGDTLAIGELRIRLEGVDAPESDQVCLNEKGDHWTCGITARNQLTEHIGGREVSCSARGTDRYHRTLAICSVAGEDLNAWLVRQGLALAYVQYSRAYVAEEAEARQERRGMWSGAFIAPWDWRLQVPLDVAHHSEMISPTVPI